MFSFCGGQLRVRSTDLEDVTFLYSLDFGGMGLHVCFCPVHSECHLLSDTDAKHSWLPDLEVTLLNLLGIGGVFSLVESYPDSPNVITLLNLLGV